MPSVDELAALCENFMFSPRRVPGVCATCFNFTDGHELCFACAHQPSVIDVVAPISYSVAHEQLHHALASYKRLTGEVAKRLTLQLAAVLWRYLDGHEQCVARAAGVTRFPLVTTVPSGDRGRDEHHPLRWIVAGIVEPTRDRHERLLERSFADVDPRAFSPDKFAAARRLDGEPVLLVDDTWTTGANARSAAAALRAAGAGPVAALVIGRHVNREWRQNDQHLRALERSFERTHCALCAPASTRVGANEQPRAGRLAS